MSVSSARRKLFAALDVLYVRGAVPHTQGTRTNDASHSLQRILTGISPDFYAAGISSSKVVFQIINSQIDHIFVHHAGGGGHPWKIVSCLLLAVPTGQARHPPRRRRDSGTQARQQKNIRGNVGLIQTIILK